MEMRDQEVEELGAGRGGVEAEEEGEEEKRRERGVLESFVVGMLTNGGIMRVEKIEAMLGMLVPGGVRGGVEEVREVLAGLREGGRVKAVGGGWGIA